MLLLQIAGGGVSSKKHVSIKAFVGEPAVSDKTLRVGDRLTSVNGQSTRGLAHQQVVMMLKQASSPVTLGLWRASATDENTIVDGTMETFTARLSKPTTGSLGLSLATVTDAEGIYIRHVADGSVAALDGTLRVGDRLFSMDDTNVMHASAGQVVSMLKQAQGVVVLKVKRRTAN